MTRRKLWEVYWCGVTFWVSALNREEALTLVRALEDGYADYTEYPITAVELNSMEADKRTYRFYDGQTCKLSNVFGLLQPYSEVITCSEWQ
jgi:hypothetical protein